MNKFTNMKITFTLRSELIADRFLSFDSVLLNAHYKQQNNKTFIKTEDDLKNLSQWIEVKNGAVSGSIWYIEKDEVILLHNVPVRKSVNRQYANKLHEATGKDIIGNKNIGNNMASGEFKAFDLAFETINPKKIYFYVRGDRGYIEKLCSTIQYFGKKASIGYGWVDEFNIEEIEQDKSFMIDEFTVSKPLSFSKNDIESKKVAYYRELPPYSDKKNQVMCYMPTTALIEMSDNSRKNKNLTVVNDKKFKDGYISNTKFLHERLGLNTKFNFSSIKAPKGLCKVEEQEGQGLFELPQQELICGCCGSASKKGLVGSLKGRVFSANFNDFAKIGEERAICESCLWSIESESCKLIDFSLVKNDEVLYLYGQKMQIFSDKKAENTKLQSLYRKDFVSNLDTLKPPFSVNFNTNAGKSNHIGFKGKVSVSNAMVVFNYGDTGDEYIDVELLKQAIIDMQEIMEKSKQKTKGGGIKKTHLLNIKDYKGNFALAKELNTFEIRVLLSNFYKKYNASIRKALHIIVV